MLVVTIADQMDPGIPLKPMEFGVQRPRPLRPPQQSANVAHSSCSSPRSSAGKGSNALGDLCCPPLGFDNALSQNQRRPCGPPESDGFANLSGTETRSCIASTAPHWHCSVPDGLLQPSVRLRCSSGTNRGSRSISTKKTKLRHTLDHAPVVGHAYGETDVSELLSMSRLTETLLFLLRLSSRRNLMKRSII